MTPPRQRERWTDARRAAYEKRRREGRPTQPWMPVYPEDEPFITVSHAAEQAMHSYLDNLESLMVMIAQRDLTPEQMDRLAMVLQRGERDLLRRFTSCAVADGQPASARPSTRSRKDRAA